MDKLTLFLMSEKGYAVLRALINLSKDIISQVVTSKDNAVEHDWHEEITNLCYTHEIPCKIRDNSTDLNYQYGLAVSWRWLIPPSGKLIVFHDSLLPKLRGFNPLVTALLCQHETIGVTALFADNEYDRGEIISQCSINISYPITIQEAIEKTLPCYEKLAIQIGTLLLNSDSIHSTPQIEKDASYSLWRDENDYRINWEKDSQHIKRHIDAVGFPYKGSLTYIGKAAYRVRQAIPVSDVTIENRSPGKVVFLEEGFPVVVCGKGLLKITDLRNDSDNSAALPLKRFRVRFE